MNEAVTRALKAFKALSSEQKSEFIQEIDYYKRHSIIRENVEKSFSVQMGRSVVGARTAESKERRDRSRLTRDFPHSSPSPQAFP